MSLPKEKKTAPKKPSNTQKNIDISIGILNGIVGDFLEKEKNPLAIQMAFVHKNQSLQLNPESLDKQFPKLKNKICILAHGLSCDESQWSFPEESKKDYGSLLDEDLAYSPFYLRYNSGLHISTNGQKFALLMEELYINYPSNIEEVIIIGHSMGGLITRSACHFAKENDLAWVKKVRHLFFLGSPHQGAPLEKFGNILTNVLDFIPRAYTQKIAEVIKVRSSGIKDLRYGYLSDQDWDGKNPDELLKNNKQNIPLLEGAQHYIINGMLTKNPKNIISQWFGDLMVRKPSALGHHKEKSLLIPFNANNHKEFTKVHHLKLCHYPAAYDQIKEWLLKGE